jgi:multiple sugar transport system permease protein
MTAETAPIRADTALEVAPVGDRTVRWRRRLAYLILITYSLLMFVPFAWSVITSFKTQPDSVRLTVIPQPITLAGWETAFNDLQPGLVRLFINSSVIAVVVTATNLILASMAGYAFARLRFPGREVLFLLVLATLMIPDQLRMVPVFQMMFSVGLTKGLLQYVAVFIVLAIGAAPIFLLRQYFLSIPREIEEAAKIDGAGYFMTFARVILPLAAPAVAAVAILTFQGTWNGLFWPLVLLQQGDHWTIPVALGQFRQQFTTQWPPLMAVVVLATLPIVILYVFFQRYFVEGVAAAGVKG